MKPVPVKIVFPVNRFRDQKPVPVKIVFPANLKSQRRKMTNSNKRKRKIQKFPTVTQKVQKCSAARQAMAAVAWWSFAEVFSCSSSHGSYSPVVFFTLWLTSTQSKCKKHSQPWAVKLASWHHTLAMVWQLPLVMWTAAVVGDGVDKTSDSRKRVLW